MLRGATRGFSARLVGATLAGACLLATVGCMGRHEGADRAQEQRFHNAGYEDATNGTATLSFTPIALDQDCRTAAVAEVDRNARKLHSEWTSDELSAFASAYEQGCESGLADRFGPREQ